MPEAVQSLRGNTKQRMGTYTIHSSLQYPPNCKEMTIMVMNHFLYSIASEYMELISMVLVMVLMNKIYDFSN